MKNRHSNSIDNIDNYFISISNLQVEGFEQLETKQRAVVVTELKGTKRVSTLINANAPEKSKIWELEDKEEYLSTGHKEDAYFKVAPKDIFDQVRTFVYKGAPSWRPAVKGIDVLKDGSKFIFSIGSRRKKSDPVSSVTTHTFSPDLTLDIYRTVGYRYDIMRNDYWMELRFDADRMGINGSLWIPLPFPSWRLDDEEKSYKFWEKYLFKLFDSWKSNMKGSKTVSDIKTETYKLLCGGRKDSDFTIGSEKYNKFSRMKELMMYTEQQVGVNLLSIWLAGVLWLIDIASDDDNLNANLYGAYAEKSYEYNNLFFNYVEHGWPLA